MKFVKIVHPDIEGEAEVPETAVGHHLAAGWQLVEDHLAELPKAQLEKIAEDRGVPVPKGAKKSDLLEAVAASETPDRPV